MENKRDGIVYKELSVERLFEYYKPSEVEAYCKACPNYNQNWSCPPYDHDVLSPVRKYRKVMIIGVKTKNFEFAKRVLADRLNLIAAETGNLVLVAGNCDYCHLCTKSTQTPCVYPDQMKYSLESLGFHVSEICDKELNQPLVWNSKDPEYLAVIGVFFNEEFKVELDIFKIEG